MYVYDHTTGAVPRRRGEAEMVQFCSKIRGGSDKQPGYTKVLVKPFHIAPGGRKQILPPGTTVRLIERKDRTEDFEDRGYSTSFETVSYMVWETA
jgi:hypothetical protein